MQIIDTSLAILAKAIEIAQLYEGNDNSDKQNQPNQQQDKPLESLSPEADVKTESGGGNRVPSPSVAELADFINNLVVHNEDLANLYLDYKENRIDKTLRSERMQETFVKLSENTIDFENLIIKYKKHNPNTYNYADVKMLRLVENLNKEIKQQMQNINFLFRRQNLSQILIKSQEKRGAARF